MSRGKGTTGKEGSGVEVWVVVDVDVRCSCNFERRDMSTRRYGRRRKSKRRRSRST